MGTAKTLQEAIDNGWSHWSVYLEWTPSDQITMKASDFIKKHINDFLAQKVGAEMLQSKSAELEDALRRIYGDL